MSAEARPLRSTQPLVPLRKTFERGSTHHHHEHQQEEWVVLHATNIFGMTVQCTPETLLHAGIPMLGQRLGNAQAAKMTKAEIHGMQIQITTTNQTNADLQTVDHQHERENILETRDGRRRLTQAQKRADMMRLREDPPLSSRRK